MALTCHLLHSSLCVISAWYSFILTLLYILVEQVPFWDYYWLYENHCPIDTENFLGRTPGIHGCERAYACLVSTCLSGWLERTSWCKAGFQKCQHPQRRACGFQYCGKQVSTGGVDQLCLSSGLHPIYRHPYAIRQDWRTNHLIAPQGSNER